MGGDGVNAASILLQALLNSPEGEFYNCGNGIIVFWS
jgi:hypothetical protein